MINTETDSRANLMAENNLNKEILAKAATEVRGLSMDAVTACSSGHLGLPLGATEIGAVLFGHSLNLNPDDPHWINRDRFVLSAGHGSMFLYSWLHLAGFDLPLEEIKNFRQLHSKTPGHPEFKETPGVECTTGPLGQGVGNAIGMAIAAKMAAAHFNTTDHTIIDHEIVCLAGDGCLQEGVSFEAASLGAHLGLDNFILFYDSNDVTLDAMADQSQSENAAARFEALGYDVVTIDGHDMDEILKAYLEAKSNKNNKPKFIICKTLIGKGIPEVAGTQKAHGEAGVKFVKEARKALGLPDETFYVSDEVRNYFKEHKERSIENYNNWLSTFNDWKKNNPTLAKTLQEGLDYSLPKDFLKKLSHFPKDANVATRAAGGTILNEIAKELPLIISGSADLHGSTKNYINGGENFTRDNPKGRNLLFGIREHGMGAIVNGIGYYGIFRPSGATFLTFSDYMRPSIRLAALAQLPIFHIFTHDSVGVGEDGPTHQPVETTSALRLIPNLDVIRPGDAEETVGAFVAALEKTNGPTALILSRQNLPYLKEISIDDRREGVLKGAYIAKKENKNLEIIILATGSELQHAMKAAESLGDNVRVVSMPCMERFERQVHEYKEYILPSSCKKRIAIEAGVTNLWYKYVGLDGKVIGIDRFGLSAPGDIVMKELGITAEAIIERAKE